MDEQLREAIEELNRTMNGLGTTATTGKGQLADAFNSSKLLAGKGKLAADAVEQLGKSVTKLTGQIYKGEQGQKKYADAVDEAATAISAVTFAMGPLAKILTVLGMAFVKYFKASTEMGDKLFKSYQDLSRSGAAASDGLKGMFTLMQDFRLSMDDLPQLGAIIKENAQALAIFRGSVYEGARSMGDIRKAINNSELEEQFMGLGMNTQEINETLGGFVNIYTQMGFLQQKNTKQATEALRGYVFELDAITKLTGASRREQEAAAQKAMAIEQFRVKIAQLERKGDAASLKEAERLRKSFTVLNAASPELAAQFAMLTQGFVGPGSIGAFLLSNGDALRAATDSSLEFGETVELFSKGLGQSMGEGGLGETMGSIGRLNEITGLTADGLYTTVRITKDFAEKLDKAKTEAEKQALLQEIGLQNMVKTQKADLNSMQAMQRFVEYGVGPATSALAALAGVVESLTSMLPGKRTAATTAAGAAGMGVGAAIGSAIAPGIGTAIGAGIGGLAGGIYGFIKGGAPAPTATEAGMINPNDVFEFGGNTGDLAHFQQLDTGVQQRALMMAADYLRMTGRKLRLNSAFRSLAEQSSVQATGGAPKAAPGSSLHERGRAMDFNKDQVAFMEQQGLLSKYGFRSGASFNDPQHVQALQLGGPAFRGRSYLVGERGPELFTPGQSGAVTSNDALQRAMGAGLDQQIDLARAQVSIGERMVAIMENQNRTLGRILQVQQA